MADLDVLTEIEAKSFPEAEKAGRESFRARLEVFPECFLILEMDGRPVGLVDGMVTRQRTISDDLFEDAAKHEPEGCFQTIFGLAVIPEARRRGCAGRLLRAFIEKARTEGRRGVILTCKRALRPYYAKFGFVDRGLSRSVHGGAEWFDMELLFEN